MVQTTKDYSYVDFLNDLASRTVEFTVNQNIDHANVEAKLPETYRRAGVAASGVSILIMLLALPVFLLIGWIWGVLVIVGGAAFYLYTKKLNYRVYVRAQVKDEPEFFDYCQSHDVITITKKGEKAHD